MRYLFILALLFIGCDKDSTSPDMTEQCNCPTNETTADEACRLFTDDGFTDQDCLEYCEIDQVDEGFISACTECLEYDDCDDAIEAYSECAACLEDCVDEQTTPGCTDYCEATDACSFSEMGGQGTGRGSHPSQP